MSEKEPVHHPPEEYRQTTTTAPSASTFGQRLKETDWSKRWSWNLFTLAMGSGAVMICTHSVPYKFHGQDAAATIWFMIDLLLFLLCLIMTTIRAIRHPRVFRRTFYDQVEAPWIPTFNLALATLLLGTIDLGIPKTGPWLITACEVFFYIYMFLGACTALILQNTFRLLPRPLHLTGPVECLEVFPLMLVGTIGSLLAPEVERLRPQNALTILVFAIVAQGLGLFMSILKLSVWMTHNVLLPQAPHKTIPAYMICAGVPGYTALALVNIGNAALTIFPNAQNRFLETQGLDPVLVAQVFAVVGNWFGLLISGMFAWVMLVYVGWGILNLVDMVRNRYVGKYCLSWWAWTFPLTGMITCWGNWAKLLPSKAFGVLNIIGALFVFCMWIFNVIGTSTLIYSGEIGHVPEPSTESPSESLREFGVPGAVAEEEAEEMNQLAELEIMRYESRCRRQCQDEESKICGRGNCQCATREDGARGKRIDEDEDDDDGDDVGDDEDNRRERGEEEEGEYSSASTRVGIEVLTFGAGGNGSATKGNEDVKQATARGVGREKRGDA